MVPTIYSVLKSLPKLWKTHFQYRSDFFHKTIDLETHKILVKMSHFSSSILNLNIYSNLYNTYFHFLVLLKHKIVVFLSQYPLKLWYKSKITKFISVAVIASLFIWAYWLRYSQQWCHWLLSASPHQITGSSAACRGSRAADTVTAG